MATLKNQNRTVEFNFGGELDFHQVKSILTGNAGNRASNDQIRKYLLDEGWEESHVDEFIDFANSERLNEMLE